MENKHLKISRKKPAPKKRKEICPKIYHNNLLFLNRTTFQTCIYSATRKKQKSYLYYAPDPSFWPPSHPPAWPEDFRAVHPSKGISSYLETCRLEIIWNENEWIEKNVTGRLDFFIEFDISKFIKLAESILNSIPQK